MTQFVPPTFSSLCSLLGRPIVLTGVLREILVRHFLTADTIEDPALRHLLWRGDERTGILVESEHRWRPEAAGRRPAVIVKRNAYAYQRAGIGDLQMGPSTDRFGQSHYANLWTGSHTLFCIGSGGPEAGAQAEILSTEVAREMHQFGPVIRDTLHLHRFGVASIGEVSELEEAYENFVVPVDVAYAYEDRWVLNQEAPTLRHVSLSTVLQC